MEIPNDLKNDIWAYCRANDITNIDEFKLRLLKQGFTVEKYGTPKVGVVEKIIEKIVEVPQKDSEMLVEFERLKEENARLIEINNKLAKELKEEKNKTDLYGEN